MNSIELIEDAIKREQAAQQRYKEGVSEAEDPETRSLFEQLIKWEESHERLLRDRLTAIKLIKGAK